MIYIYTTFLFIQKFQQQHPVYPERFKESSPIAQARILPRLLPIYLSIRCRVMGLRHANTRGRPADNKCLNDTRWGKRGYIQESFASFVACFFRTVINATRYSSFPANVFYAYKVSASIWVYIYHGIYIVQYYEKKVSIGSSLRSSWYVCLYDLDVFLLFFLIFHLHPFTFGIKLDVYYSRILLNFTHAMDYTIYTQSRKERRSEIKNRVEEYRNQSPWFWERMLCLLERVP